MTGLAIADPNALNMDIFRTDKGEADISLSDLLRKRMAIDRVVIDICLQWRATEGPWSVGRSPAGAFR